MKFSGLLAQLDLVREQYEDLEGAVYSERGVREWGPCGVRFRFPIRLKNGKAFPYAVLWGRRVNYLQVALPVRYSSGCLRFDSRMGTCSPLMVPDRPLVRYRAL
jgi:hypothetical protein